jgi:hypothetical protein
VKRYEANYRSGNSVGSIGPGEASFTSSNAESMAAGGQKDKSDRTEVNMQALLSPSKNPELAMPALNLSSRVEVDSGSAVGVDE